MAKFKYTGTEGRHFLRPRAFTVEPGEIVEDDENPDPLHFVPVPASPVAVEKKEKA